MCQEFCTQGGVCLSACWDTTPGKETPLARRHPSKADPPAQCMLGDTVNKRVVCILLECNLVQEYNAQHTELNFDANVSLHQENKPHFTEVKNQ